MAFFDDVTDVDEFIELMCFMRVMFAYFMILLL